MTERAAILVVEDDVPTRTFLADNLTADGYDVHVAATLREALHRLECHHVDLAVVDVGLPDGSGLELLRKVREAGGSGARLDARLPMIVLSGRAGETDRVRGFERGWDDFLPKPFSYGELRLRVAALLRRAQERPSQGRLRVGELELDPVAREVRLRGARVTLSQKEFALLRQLAAEPTRVFTRVPYGSARGWRLDAPVLCKTEAGALGTPLAHPSHRPGNLSWYALGSRPSYVKQYP